MPPRLGGEGAFRTQFRGDLLAELLGRPREAGGLAPDSANRAEMRLPSDPENLEELAPIARVSRETFVEGVAQTQPVGHLSALIQSGVGDDELLINDGERLVDVRLQPDPHLLEDQGHALVDHLGDGLGLPAEAF